LAAYAAATTGNYNAALWATSALLLVGAVILLKLNASGKAFIDTPT
jgi:hypothetical protein